MKIVGDNVDLILDGPTKWPAYKASFLVSRPLVYQLMLANSQLERLDQQLSDFGINVAFWCERILMDKQ